MWFRHPASLTCCVPRRVASERMLRKPLGAYLRGFLQPILTNKVAGAILVAAGLGLGFGLGSQYVSP